MNARARAVSIRRSLAPSRARVATNTTVLFVILAQAQECENGGLAELIMDVGVGAGMLGRSFETITIGQAPKPT